MILANFTEFKVIIKFKRSIQKGPIIIIIIVKMRKIE